jgi:hypothetical protein
MRFARWVFLLAGASGILAVAPLYLEEAFFARSPPPTNRPEFYYGFAGVALAWQLLFLVIGTDPVRYRLAMLPAMVEKLGFSLAIPILYAQGRVDPSWLGAATFDGTWLILFVASFILTPIHSEPGSAAPKEPPAQG